MLLGLQVPMKLQAVFVDRLDPRIKLVIAIISKWIVLLFFPQQQIDILVNLGLLLAKELTGILVIADKQLLYLLVEISLIVEILRLNHLIEHFIHLSPLALQYFLLTRGRHSAALPNITAHILHHVLERRRLFLLLLIQHHVHWLELIVSTWLEVALHALKIC